MGNKHGIWPQHTVLYDQPHTVLVSHSESLVFLYISVCTIGWFLFVLLKKKGIVS